MPNVQVKDDSMATTTALFKRIGPTVGAVTLVQKVPDESREYDFEVKGGLKDDDFLNVDSEDVPNGTEFMIYGDEKLMTKISKEPGLYQQLGQEGGKGVSATGTRGWLQFQLSKPEFKGWAKRHGEYGIYGPSKIFFNTSEIEAILGHPVQKPMQAKRMEPGYMVNLKGMMRNRDVELFMQYYNRLEREGHDFRHVLPELFDRAIVTSNGSPAPTRLIIRFLLMKAERYFDKDGLVNGSYRDMDFLPTPIYIAISTADEWLGRFLITNGAVLTEKQNDPSMEQIIKSSDAAFMRALVDHLKTLRAITAEEARLLEKAGLGNLV